MSEIYLDESEIKGITKKVRPSAQIMALSFMGIDFRQRPDGTLLVLRAELEPSYAGDKKAKKQKAQPNWSAV